MEILTNPEIWISLLSLTALEVVLGIDNVVFISILAANLPEHQQSMARKVGLIIALLGRLILLSGLSWLARLNQPIMSLFNHDLSWRDLILVAGGLFLLAKATIEIYRKVELEEPASGRKHISNAVSMTKVLIQIALVDMVFSLDSILTAIGMAKHLGVMMAAVILAIIIMIIFADAISNFVNRNPSIKILALAFLVMIGVLLTAEGFGEHINKGYIYFGMAFSLCIEMLNLRYDARKKAS